VSLTCLSISNSFTKLDASKAVREIVATALTYEDQEVIYAIFQARMQLKMAFKYKNASKINFFKAKIAELEKCTTVCFLREDDHFPTGHIDIVVAALQKAGIGVNLVDLRKAPKPYKNYRWVSEQPTLRFYQSDMLKLGQEQHRGVFEAAVGSGKTVLLKQLVMAFKVPSLIIAPSKDLAQQIYDVFAEAFGTNQVELSTGKDVTDNAPIRIVHIHVLQSMLKKGTLSDYLSDIGLVCVDEVHHSGASSYVELLPYFEHIYYRFGCSGTFLRNDSKTLDMFGFLSKVLYRYSAAQATADGFLTPLQVMTHDIPGRMGTNYHNEYTKNYCENTDLLLKIKEIVLEVVADGEQTLILVGRKEKSGAVIHKYLETLGVDAVFISGDSDREEVKQSLKDFNARKIKVLIGSSIIGEGIDIKSTDHLIMCQGGKSEIAVTQAVGRAVRLFPGKHFAVLHDFRFEGTRYLEKHLELRLGIYHNVFAAETLL